MFYVAGRPEFWNHLLIYFNRGEVFLIFIVAAIIAVGLFNHASKLFRQNKSDEGWLYLGATFVAGLASYTALETYNNYDHIVRYFSTN